MIIHRFGYSTLHDTKLKCGVTTTDLALIPICPLSETMTFISSPQRTGRMLLISSLTLRWFYGATETWFTLHQNRLWMNYAGSLDTYICQWCVTHKNGCKLVAGHFHPIMCWHVAHFMPPHLSYALEWLKNTLVLSVKGWTKIYPYKLTISIS